ncbi:hypothetical protein ACIPSA_46345 [Streptomyces sp. NPDC086549]|uniref:hypothetical protein n=1 Tax=Streptomyces sp. NPDC086549 TaxID=3365752 RepID=UPI003805CE9A
MPHSTHTDGSLEAPTAYGWCAWHKGFSSGVRVMQIHEQGSGPGTGRNLLACSPCREVHGLVPLSDRP